MDNRYGQSGFHFLISDLNAFKQEHSFIFPGANAQTFGAKNKIIFVPYFTVLGTQCDLRLCGKILLTLKTSPIIACESPYV